MIEPKGSWTFRTHNCFRCARALEEDEKRYTIPLEGHYLNQVMAVGVCKECHREWKLKELDI
jgi:C4-type Zn-finger protein